MKNNLILPYIFMILLYACNSADNKTFVQKLSNKVESFLEEDIANYKYVIIIPGAGCSGCITQAESFFIKNVNNESIKFIFTNNSSRKQLFLKLKEENLTRDNVFIDSDNNFHLRQYEESIYPFVATISDSKIIELKMFDNLFDKE